MSDDPHLTAGAWMVFGVVAMYLVARKARSVHLRLACAAGAALSVGMFIYKATQLLGLAFMCGIFVSVLFYAALTMMIHGEKSDQDVFKDC